MRRYSIWTITGREGRPIQVPEDYPTDSLDTLSKAREAANRVIGLPHGYDRVEVRDTEGVKVFYQVSADKEE